MYELKVEGNIEGRDLSHVSGINLMKALHTKTQVAAAFIRANKIHMIFILKKSAGKILFSIVVPIAKACCTANRRRRAPPTAHKAISRPSFQA